MLNEAKTSRPRPRPRPRPKLRDRGRGRGRGQDYEVEDEAEAKNNYEKSNKYWLTTYDLRLLPEKLTKFPNFTWFLDEKYPIT